MKTQTWSQPPLLFSLSSLPLSLLLSLLLPSLDFTGSQITVFFQKQTQSRWYTGPLSQMALQVLSKWSMAFKEEGSVANSLPWGRCISRTDSLPLRLISLREALGDCDCRVRPWAAGVQEMGVCLASCWDGRSQALPLIGHHPGPPHPGRGSGISPLPNCEPQFPQL